MFKSCLDKKSIGAIERDFHFPIGILGQVWYLIVSIPNLCTLTLMTQFTLETTRSFYILHM